MLINVEQYDYMNGYHKSAGLQLLVTDHGDENILVEHNGYGVSVGTQTSMALSYKNVRN